MRRLPGVTGLSIPWLWAILLAICAICSICVGGVYLWRSTTSRQWRAVKGTPLAALADALVRRGKLYGKLLEMGWSPTAPDRRPTLRACGFDTQNGWHWLDVEVDRSVIDAWCDAKKQRQVRALLQTRLVYFKPAGPEGRVVRVWWKSPSNKGTRVSTRP